MIREALLTQLGYTYYATLENLRGLGHEDALVTAEEGGNCINWVLGHMVNTRNVMLARIGAAPVMDEAGRALYGRGSKPLSPGSDHPTLDTLVELLEASQKTLMEGIASLDEAALAQEIPELFDDTKTETCANQLATLLFHEAYHAGQIGSIRRVLGKEGAIQ